MISHLPLYGPMAEPADGGRPRRLVVLLHGYGSDGADLIALAPYWQDLMPDALFLAPNAPERCALNPMGHQWFAIDLEDWSANTAGIKAAAPALEEYLKALWAETGLGPGETVLCGFSQGAMMALHVGLRLDEAVQAIVAFSGALVVSDDLPGALGAEPPVCLVHGEADEVVAVAQSIGAERVLRDLGLDVELMVCRGQGHTIPPEGFEFASRFLARVVGETGPARR